MPTNVALALVLAIVVAALLAARRKQTSTPTERTTPRRPSRLRRSRLARRRQDVAPAAPQRRLRPRLALETTVGVDAAVAETDAPRQPQGDDVAPVAEPSVPAVPVTAAATDETAAPGGTGWVGPVDAPGWPIPGELTGGFSIDDSDPLPEPEPADVAPAAPRDGARSGVAVNARDVTWEEGEAPAAAAESAEGPPAPIGLGEAEAWTGDDSEWTAAGATAAIASDAPFVGIEPGLGAEYRSLIDDRSPALSWPDDGGTAAADSPTYVWDVKTSDVAGDDVWSEESQNPPADLSHLWDEPDTPAADAIPMEDAAVDPVWEEETVDATTEAWHEDLAAVRALTDEVPHLLEDARTAVATAAGGAPTIVVMLGSAREQELVESIRRLEEQVAALTEQLAGLPAGGPRRSARTVARTPARAARSGSRAETKTRTSSTRSPTTGTATKATAKPATKRAATATATKGAPTKATAKPATKRTAAAVAPAAKTPAKSAATKSTRTSARTATKSPAKRASNGRGEPSPAKTAVTSDAVPAARTRAKATSNEAAKRTTASDGKRKAAKRITAA